MNVVTFFYLSQTRQVSAEISAIIRRYYNNRKEQAFLLQYYSDLK